MKFLLVTFTMLVFTQDIFANDINPAEEKTVQELLSENSENTQVVTALPNDNFAAIVQHHTGRPYLQNKKRKRLEFKNIIDYKDTIIVPKNNSRLKLITQKRCVVVMYANTKVVAPNNKDDSWKVIQGAVRWICPEGNIENIVYKKSPILVEGGEVLISKNQLITLKPKVKYFPKPKDLDNQQEFIFENLYILKGRNWHLAKNQKNSYELYKYDQTYPSPQESARKFAIVPTDPVVKRVFLGMSPIGWSGLLHHEKDAKFSDYEMQSISLKAGVNFPYKEKSVLAFLEWSESENNDFKKTKDFLLPAGYKSLRNKHIFLATGLRHSHTKSSSYYYFAGLGYQRLEFSIKSDAFIDYHGHIKNYWNIGLGAGYHKIFFPKKWYSLILGAELKVLQTLSQGRMKHFKSSTNASAIDPKSMFTTANAQIYIAPAINF